MPRRRSARPEDLGLSPAEFAVLQRLDTPQKIEAFVYELKQNFELRGDTCRPVRGVLRERRAHCIEGAMVAACAFWIHGEPPLLMDMRAERDYDHVIALFRRNGLWGAISKTNGVGLRSRDPVYRTLRELAMSYFHEYTNKRSFKTLREYSLPYDLRRADVRVWVTGEKNAWQIPEALDELRHFPVVNGRQLRTVTRLDPFVRRLDGMLQYRRPRALIEKLERRKRQRKK